MDGLLGDMIIIATLIISISIAILTVWRLDLAKKQYEATLEQIKCSKKILKESRKYWRTRLTRDEKKRKQT